MAAAQWTRLAVKVAVCLLLVGSWPGLARAATPGPTPDPHAAADFWYEDFDAPAASQPAGWMDSRQQLVFSAQITANGASAATVTREGVAAWGKVLSPAIRCEANVYPYVEIDVSAVSSQATWRVGIQEVGTTNYWDLVPSQNRPGTIRAHYASIANWDQDKRFQVQITVEGPAGESITVNSVRVFGTRRNDPDSAFVRVSATEPGQLALGGTIVKVKGVNYYPSAHGWERMWREWDPALMDTELARCPSLGINTVRTFIHYEETGGASVTPVALARMEEFLAIAGRYGLKVEFVFFPFSRDYSLANRGPMKNHIGAILDRFRNDARILGWGITNEADIHAVVNATGADEQRLTWDWHRDMAATMKTVDSRHLLIAATGRAESYRMLDLSHVDVYDLHTGGLQDSETGIIMRLRRFMAQAGRVMPILFQEVGLDHAVNPNAGTVSSFFNRVGHSFYETDIAGGMVWSLNDIDGQLWGLFTAMGTLRPGASAYGTAYAGTDFRNPVPVARSSAPLAVEPDASGAERILLNTRLADLAQRWTATRASFGAADGGVSIYNIVRNPGQTYGYGQIKTAQTVSLNMDQETDIRIHAHRAAGLWFAFLEHPATNTRVRLQLDTPATGTFCYNLKHYLPESLRHGYQSFNIVVGAAETRSSLNAASALIENVSAVSGSRPQPGPAPAGTYWSEEFDNTIWVQPDGWSDATENAAFNAHIEQSTVRSLAAVTRTSQDIWGKVLSPRIRCDVSIYNRVEVRVARLSPSTTWKVGVQEIGGNNAYVDLNSSSNLTGTFRFPMPAGWSGVRDFMVQFTVEGAAGRFAELDGVRILSSSLDPPLPSPSLTPALTPAWTATWTRTPTATPTQTAALAATSTPTATPTPTRTATPTAIPAVNASASPTLTSTLSPTSTPSTPSSTLQTATPTASPTTPIATHTHTPTAQVLAPQAIRIWQYGSYFLKPSQSIKVLVSSLYGDAPQPCVRIRLRVIRGEGRFQGQDYVERDCGPASEPALAWFTASERSVDVTVIRADNLELGGVRYLLLPVLPLACKPLAETYAQTFPVPGCTWIKILVFDTEAEALAVADMLLARACLTPHPTAIPATATATATPSPVLPDDPSGVMVYPNPARDQATFLAGSQARSVTVDIYKISGERIAHLHEYSRLTVWRIRDVAPGIYLCRITVTDRQGRIVVSLVRKLAVRK